MFIARAPSLPALTAARPPRARPDTRRCRMSPDREAPDRLPPQNLDAERSVLGSMLRDNHVIGDVVNVVRAEHFYTDAHQKIFQAVVTLYIDRGQPADLVTLADYLQQEKQIEDVGGYPYLAELWDAAPTAANAEF